MAVILLFLSLFPYIGFGLSSSDTQPWALLLSILSIGYYIFKFKLSIPKSYIYFFITFVIVIIYFLFDLANGEKDYSAGITSITYYISTPIIALAVYNIGLPKNISKLILSVLIIWLFFAIIQIFIPSINSLLVNTVRSSEGRGLTSLAPEPVWYARSILLILVICVALYYKGFLSKNKFLIALFLGIFQIIALSLSGTIFFYLGVIIFTYVLLMFKNLKHKIILFSSVIIFGSILIWYGVNNFAEKRVFYLINVANENPENLTRYGGFSMRVLNTPMAIKAGIFETNGLGKGIFPKDENESYAFTFLSQTIYKEDGGKVNGGYVLFVYQIGFFGFIWMFGFIRSIYLNRNPNHKLNLFITISMILIVFLESSPNNPVAGYLLGVMMINSKTND